jgi:hypothetical protein
VGEIQVKMAKASKDDIQKVIAFFRLIEEYLEHGTYTLESEEGDEEAIELSQEQFIELLRKMWGGRFRPAGVDCMWSRVVFGCDMLIDNCCDPASDCLELRQDWAKAIDPPEGIEEALEHLRGNKEHFRKVLTDKTKILNSMCDYAERMAKKKRLEPWSIIGDITDHGSGVSSAIYELYRRKPASVEAAS